MEIGTRPGIAQAYEARLRGGPDDGAVVRVSPLPDGAPPDFFHAGPDDPGVYVLAGAPHEDGSLPYWFISSLPYAEQPEPDRPATWTLVSVASGDEAPRVWHQHGEGALPIQLSAETASSARSPAFIGRVYTCPECEETTVISLPEA